ncbi:MAG: ECF transporter S component [Clostridia bacterium]|nr:ECF transporter S component [Clostridia bacterium]
MKAKDKKTLDLTVMGVLVAVIFLLTYMPLKIGPIEMTLRMIPVVLGGILLGPVQGAILGGFFGLTSFFECFGLLGMPLSAFGSFMVGLDPVLTALMCFVPRIIMGFCAALIFRAFKQKSVVAHGVANVSGAVLNTVLFTGLLLILFWNNPAFIAKMQEWGLDTSNLGVFVVAFVGLNGLIEALVCVFLGTAISKNVSKAVKMGDNK